MRDRCKKRGWPGKSETVIKVRYFIVLVIFYHASLCLISYIFFFQFQALSHVPVPRDRTPEHPKSSTVLQKHIEPPTFKKQKCVR